MRKKNNVVGGYVKTPTRKLLSFLMVSPVEVMVEAHCWVVG